MRKAVLIALQDYLPRIYPKRNVGCCRTGSGLGVAVIIRILQELEDKSGAAVVYIFGQAEFGFTSASPSRPLGSMQAYYAVLTL